MDGYYKQLNKEKRLDQENVDTADLNINERQRSQCIEIRGCSGDIAGQIEHRCYAEYMNYALALLLQVWGGGSPAERVDLLISTKHKVKLRLMAVS